MRPPDPGRGDTSAEVATAKREQQGNAAESTTTARTEALERFRRAKLAFDHAAVALIRGDSFAAEQCDDALAELNRAREALRELGERGL